jgi:hypothetical protein
VEIWKEIDIERVALQFQGLYTAKGAEPYCQDIGPFSCKKPSRLEQPGPPFNQIVISSEALTFVEGKNQK